MDLAQILTSVAAAAAGVLAYMLKEKDNRLKGLETDVATLKVTQAVQAEKNEHNDQRFDQMEEKLDRIIDKLGA